MMLSKSCKNGRTITESKHHNCNKHYPADEFTNYTTEGVLIIEPADQPLYKKRTCYSQTLIALAEFAVILEQIDHETDCSDSDEDFKQRKDKISYAICEHQILNDHFKCVPDACEESEDCRQNPVNEQGNAQEQDKDSDAYQQTDCGKRSFIGFSFMSLFSVFIGFAAGFNPQNVLKAIVVDRLKPGNEILANQLARTPGDDEQDRPEHLDESGHKPEGDEDHAKGNQYGGKN